MKKYLFVVLMLLLSVPLLSASEIIPDNAGAPAGWRDLSDFYVFKDQVGGWSGSGAGELETVNGNLPIDTDVTLDNLPSLRLNITTQVTSWWWVVQLTLRGWNTHDVSQFVSNGYLEFNVKGKSGGEQFVIGVKDLVEERATGTEVGVTKPITSYCTVTTEWQHVKIPLKDLLDPSLGIDAANARAVIINMVDLNPFCVWLNQIKFTSPDKEKSYPAIKVNQVGFTLFAEKYATVSGFEDELKAVEGTPFQVKRVFDNKTVYRGRLVLVKDYDALDSGERVLKAVFTGLRLPGEYYISVNAVGIEKSPRFKISDTVYNSLLTDSQRYLYYQRTGLELKAPYCTDYPRADLTPHDSAAVFDSDPSKTKDVSKGWYNAGDLGKYVNSDATALTSLFWAYEMFPYNFKDNQLNIPESGNNIPDILDLAKWELDWILSMQDAASGGFYARVQADNDRNVTKRIIKDKEGDRTDIKSTDDTACAAAVLAHAYLLFKKYDAAFAHNCLDAAENAWKFLEKYPNNIKSPNGPYSTDNDSNNRLWAAASLYRATGEDKYDDFFLTRYTNATSAYENQYGDKLGSLSDAFFCYTKAKKRDYHAVQWFREKFSAWVKNKMDRYVNSPWGVTIANGNYYWGINSQILGICEEAAVGCWALGFNSSLVDKMALASLNWILGSNPMRKSFVSGYGEDSVKTIFSTIYSTDGLTGIPKGYMPGGPNRYEGGGISKFPAKCYMDSAGDWTMNEHTPDWNSKLIFITALANSVHWRCNY